MSYAYLSQRGLWAEHLGLGACSFLPRVSPQGGLCTRSHLPLTHSYCLAPWGSRNKKISIMHEHNPYNK